MKCPSYFVGFHCPILHVFMYDTGEIAYFYDSKHKLEYNDLVSFCISVVSLLLKYTGVFSEKQNVFFRHFLGCHLVNLTKKINFWKMKKKLSKIFKNGRFFAHLWAERPQCQHPDFWGPLFEHFHKVNDQNWVIEKIGIKGYPLYIQKIWPHFLPLFEGYFLNP